MATKLPGSAIPLDPDIKEAVEEFSRPSNRGKMIRQAAMEVLLEDLKDEIRAALKEARS